MPGLRCDTPTSHSEARVIPAALDLGGQRFGSLVALWRSSFRPGERRLAPMWMCVCDCGRLCRVRSGLLVHDQTRTCGDRARHPHSPRGTSVRYDAIHKRLKTHRGQASTHQCVDCGKQARDWSHVHDTDRADLTNYAPRCRNCHIRYDTQEVVPC